MGGSGRVYFFLRKLWNVELPTVFHKVAAPGFPKKMLTRFWARLV